jgi:hypothetical protein
MVAATKGGSKEITTLLGCEVVYLSAVADAYTYDSRFGSAKAAFFQGTTVSGIEPVAVGLTISGRRITFAISGAVTAGYLQIWGE